MKKFVAAFALSVLFAYGNPSAAHPFRKPPAERKASPTTQLQSYLMQSAWDARPVGKGVTIIRFQLDREGRITNLVSLSADDALNMEIHSHLTGRKIRGLEAGQGYIYTFRLHFRS